MKQALYYERLKDKIVQCQLCPRFCKLKPDEIGDCRARSNIDGKLFSLVYGKAVSNSIDPIEKKPLSHFLPGTTAYSIGTTGCNLHCAHCQNWETSQGDVGEYQVKELPPEKVVEDAIENNCSSIAFTYNEPTIFYEYALDTAKLTRKKGLKCIIISNGFINKDPLEKLCKYIDAANIDLKAFDDKFYRKIATAWLEPILENLKILKKNKVWLEITYLIIPKLNDDFKNIENMCEWIKNNLGTNVPLHFNAFYPCYNLKDVQPTPVETLIKAREIAIQTGLNFVYIGNINEDNFLNTYCPKCKSSLIERSTGYGTEIKSLSMGKCEECGEKVEGIWR